MRKNSSMRYEHEQEEYTFPSPMALRFQAVRAAFFFQKKYWIASLAGLLLIIAGIISAFIIVTSKDSIIDTTTVTTYPTPTSTTKSPDPRKNFSKKCSSFRMFYVYIVFSSRQ